MVSSFNEWYVAYATQRYLPIITAISNLTRKTWRNEASKYVKKGFEPSVFVSNWTVTFWIVGWTTNQVVVDEMVFAGL